MAVKRFVLPDRSQGQRDSLEKKRRPHILYVEDDDMNWQVAEKILREHYEITRANSAREVFAQLGKNAFDAILMDIELADSELNGIEITKAMKSASGESLPEYAQDLDRDAVPPVIFVTAYKSRYSETELRTYGGDGLIAKPVDFTELCCTLARAISKNMLNRF